MPKPLIAGLSQEDAKRLRALVVDDNEYMRRLLLEFLRVLRVGTIRGAGDGAVALTLMRILRPDLVLVDLRMDQVDGFDFVRRVRAGDSGTNPYVPIIMITGHADAPRVHDARDAGVNELLVKPVSFTTVAQRTGAVLTEPRPFIRAAGYLGPDRRRRSTLVDIDRRKAAHGLITPGEILTWKRCLELSEAV